MRLITSFLRLNADGTVEHISWSKNKAGDKVCDKKQVTPTANQLATLKASPYGEYTL